MLKRDGDEFLHGMMSRIEAKGVGRAGERRMLALLVEDVALADDVAFALRMASLRADFGAGVEVKFVGRLRKDDGADVAALHDQRGQRGKTLLLRNKKFADRSDLRDERNAFVDAAFADVRKRIEAGDVKNEFAFAEAGFDSGGMDFARDGIGILKRNFLLQKIPSDAPVHRAGVDVNITEALGELARKGAFAGSGGAVNGDNRMRKIGHDACERAVQKSALRGGCEENNPGVLGNLSPAAAWSATATYL